MRNSIFMLLLFIITTTNLFTKELDNKAVLLVTMELENDKQRSNSSSYLVNAMVDDFWNGGSMMVDIMADDPHFIDDAPKYVKMAKDNNLETILLIKIDYNIDIKANNSYMTKMEISYKIFSLEKNELIREEFIEDRSLNRPIRSDIYKRNIFRNLGHELFKYINDPANYPTKNLIKNSLNIQ